MRIIAVWCFIYFLPVVTIHAQPSLGLPFIKYYSSNEYNAGIQNWFITQDSRGIIYVANNFGLLEFDGSSWITYPVANSGKVRHITFTSDKKIAIASQGEFGYFINNEQGQWIYHSISGNLPDNQRDFEETWKVFNLEGKDYFCTTNKIYVVEDNATEFIHSDVRIDNFFLVNQKIYVHIPTAGLQVLQNNEYKTVSEDPRLLNKWVSQIIPLSNNRLLVVTKQDGVFIVDEYNQTVWKPDQQEILSQSIINSAIRLRNGDFAFGTQNNGLMVYSPEGELKSHLTKGYGLNERTIICLFEDMQNNLWAGHNNGISHIEFGQPFSFINEQMGLHGTGYAGIQDGRKLYLATNNGLFVGDDTKNQWSTKFQLLKGTEGQVYHVSKIQNRLLIGHNDGSFISDNSGSVNKISNSGTWLFRQINTIPNYLISGTYIGLELYQKVNEPTTYQWKWRLDGFDESCRIMEQDDYGNIWMAHGYKGLFRFRLSDNLKSVEEVKFYGVEQGFPSNVLIGVYKIRGNLAFTTTDGVYQYNKESDRFVKDPFFEKFFEPGSPLNVLAEDANQNIYFLGQREIGVLKKNPTGDYYKETDKFVKIKGMLNDDLQNISILENNKVLYGAKEGFIVYDPIQDIPYQYNFNVLIRRITLTGMPDSTIFFGNFPSQTNDSPNSPGTGNYNFSAHHNSLRFEYSATFMDGMGETTYQYFLDGYDHEWSEWSNKNEKEYTNLNEGNYVFQIRAKNIYGQISKEANYQFSIMPPWHRSKLAYTSYFLAFSLSFSLFLFFIGQKHKKEKNTLRQHQEQELSKKESELLNIKTASEREIEKLKTEKLKADISHKNKELATSTMHLINKNEFISQVKQNLTMLVRKNPEDPLANDLEKIMTSIERNISSDDDWQHFEIHFDQVHGDFSKRLKDKYPNLSPQDRRLCAYLRMNMTTKEIANLLNITVRGAEISRYRLRKKLGLSRDFNLAEYILNF